MNIDEIRAAKLAAENDIRDRLIELQKVINMCPVGVLLSGGESSAKFEWQRRAERSVVNVTIELERI